MEDNELLISQGYCRKRFYKVNGKAPVLIKQSVDHKEMNFSLHPINFLFGFIYVSCSDFGLR